jgi:hypothetical protein
VSLIATVAMVAAGLAGGSQGVAQASVRGSGAGAGISTKYMDAKGGTAPASATGNAHDVRKAASAGAGRPSGHPAGVP